VKRRETSPGRSLRDCSSPLASTSQRRRREGWGCLLTGGDETGKGTARTPAGAFSPWRGGGIITRDRELPPTVAVTVANNDDTPPPPCASVPGVTKPTCLTLGSITILDARLASIEGSNPTTTTFVMGFFSLGFNVLRNPVILALIIQMAVD
jgi:hypothetical protein